VSSVRIHGHGLSVDAFEHSPFPEMFVAYECKTWHTAPTVTPDEREKSQLSASRAPLWPTDSTFIYYRECIKALLLSRASLPLWS